MEGPKLALGNVLVVTTEHKGHDPEFWAETIADRVVSVGGNCHPLIAQQAAVSYTHLTLPTSHNV